MTGYQKAFLPARATVPSTVLYSMLSDGSPRPVDEMVDLMADAVPVNVAVRWGASPRPDADPHRAIASRRRKIALNALMVARRTGRVIETDGLLRLEPSVAEAWTAYTKRERAQ